MARKVNSSRQLPALDGRNLPVQLCQRRRGILPKTTRRSRCRVAREAREAGDMLARFALGDHGVLIGATLPNEGSKGAISLCGVPARNFCKSNSSAAESNSFLPT